MDFILFEFHFSNYNEDCEINKYPIIIEMNVLP